MKTTQKISTLLLLVLLVSACKINKNLENNNGFTALFNGKNWDGWYKKIRTGDAALADKVYAIENGMIHVFKEVPAGSEEENGNNPTHGLFYTNKTYSKFIFKFEYKWGEKKANNFSKFQYDAGMYYHVIDDAIWPKGLEYQVRYNSVTNKNHTGDIWGLPGYNWTAKDNQFAFEKDGGTPQEPRGMEHLAKPTQNYNALNGKWNQCEVIVMGDKYAIHKLNGDIVNVLTNLPVGEGKIGLQSETAEIYYRNIQIKEFKEIIPIEQFIKK